MDDKVSNRIMTEMMWICHSRLYVSINFKLVGAEAPRTPHCPRAERLFNVGDHLAYRSSQLLQSGFRPSHSTETAVLRLLSEVPRAVSHGDIAALVLLDLSTHSTTSSATRFRFNVGEWPSFAIHDTVHQWFQLWSNTVWTPRVNRVIISVNECPQGWVLAPCYLFYSAPIWYRWLKTPIYYPVCALTTLKCAILANLFASQLSESEYVGASSSTEQVADCRQYSGELAKQTDTGIVAFGMEFGSVAVDGAR